MIKPLFPFYGSKWRDAKRYPFPDGTEIVVEPFAGSAGYSLYHEPPRVELYDVDPYIVSVWQYLIGVTGEEILRLPDLEEGQSVDELPAWIPQEARWLIGFWLNRGSAQPKRTQTAFSRRTDRQQLVWSQRARDRIAADVHRVKHWSITQCSYEYIMHLHSDDVVYFVDPPYVDKGRYYRFRDVDYPGLARWVGEISSSTVIVCEQQGADWLPFESLASIKSTKGRSEEVVYLRQQNLHAILTT